MLYVIAHTCDSFIKQVSYYFLSKQKISSLMKLGELYTHICLHALIHIFFIKLLCMHDVWMYNIVAIYIAPYSTNKSLNPTLLISRRSSEGDESNRVYWFQTRFFSLIYLWVVFIVKVQL